jgi:DNA-binding response OmpR family regulator
MKRRLLMLDDELPILRAMSTYFELSGYVVDYTAEREEAEALLVNNQYACLIVDLRLTPHGADGLDVLSFAREMSPATRVVILTAYGSPAVEREARRRGADAFLQKPRPLAEILSIVGALVGPSA